MFFDIVELKHTHVDERHVIIHVGIIHVGFLVNFVRADHREMKELKGGGAGASVGWQRRRRVRL